MNIGTEIAEWKRRLKAMADNPPYSYLETPEHLIDQEYARLTNFEGFLESEIADAERRLGLRFPAVFRGFLQQIAKAPGDLFCGIELAGISELEEFKTRALELMSETDPVLSLPSEAVVFLFIQGYQFMYFVPTGEPDVPVMFWEEGIPGPKQEATSFVQFIENALETMERNNRRSQDNREHFVTLSPEGGRKMLFPAAGTTATEALADVQDFLERIPMAPCDSEPSPPLPLQRLWNWITRRGDARDD